MFPPPSPSLKTAGSYNNLRKSNRFSNASNSTTRSSSPIRSVSSKSDSHYNKSQKIRLFRNISNNSTLASNNNHESYTGKITVAIRPKPISTNERQCWRILDENRILNNEVGEFHFDNVFKQDITNLEIYNELCKPLIDKLTQGFNSTLFAYGMTGSGKTFTMSGTPEDVGIIPLSVSHLYNTINEESLRGDRKFETLVSYMEIYNEKLYDLLDMSQDNSISSYNNFSQTPTRYGANLAPSPDLRIRDDPQYGVKVMGLAEHRCSSNDELMQWVKFGNRNRKTSETEYNSRSSRSHAILLIRLISTDLSTGQVTTSTLSLCDLAGSEKAASQQERRKEGAFINKSLLALGTVIAKLSSESSQNKNIEADSHSDGTNPNNAHIPYRDSKLTRILQPALSGNSIITTICTVDTRSDVTTETLNTLRFASRAKNVSLHVTKKHDYGTREEKDKLIYSLMQQLEEQKKVIEGMNTNNFNKNFLDFEKPIVPFFTEEMMSSPNKANHVNNNNNNSTQQSNNIINPNYALLESENKVLKFKLEHCEKLLDKDVVELQDPQLINIVEMLPDGVDTLLEMKVQGLESQIRQYKSYTADLERKLTSSRNGNNLFTNDIGLNSPVNSSSSSRVTSHNSDISMVDTFAEDNSFEVIKQKEEEILQLKKRLERKDKMIEALQSARRLRERALKPLTEVNILYQDENEVKTTNDMSNL